MRVFAQVADAAVQRQRLNRRVLSRQHRAARQPPDHLEPVRPGQPVHFRLGTLIDNPRLPAAAGFERLLETLRDLCAVLHQLLGHGRPGQGEEREGEADTYSQ